LYKIITLCKEVPQETFEKFYYGFFSPQVLKIDGVVKVELTHLFPSGINGQTDQTESYSHLMEIYFHSAEAFEEAIRSPRGIELLGKMLEYVGDYITAYVGKEEVCYRSIR
jgi:uncharacterized protein (TIGR02118 family)